MAAKKKFSPVMKFLVDYLKKKPKASFAEVRDAAAKKRLKIYPISYGRAQALLGHVKMAPRGSGKAAKAKAAKKARSTAGRVKRGPGRPRKTSTALDSLESVIQAMKNSEAERSRYKRALDQIANILDGAL